jgi:hypothetical protein
VFTPGIAAAAIYAAYLQWLWQIFAPAPLWHHFILWGSMLLILLACCGFAGWVRAIKFGTDRVASRTLKLGFQLLLVQVVIAPAVAWFGLWLIWGR